MFGGEWEQVTDRFILAAGNTYTAGTTGGSTTHSHDLSSDTHARIIGTGTDLYEQYITLKDKWESQVHFTLPSQTHTTDTTLYAVPVKGGTENTKALPPYEVAYCWHRIG